MRNIIIIILVSLFISGCNKGFLPGMSGIGICGLPRHEVCPTIAVRPVVVPITASLIVKQPPPFYIYHVASQDVLSISVWRHPEFNPPVETTALSATTSTQAAGVAGYLVNHNGQIYFPLIGYVQVAGKTIDQVRNLITLRLNEYIRNPQVNVRVADYRSKRVYVLGEVMKPSLLPLNDQPMSITDALIMSGSIDSNSADPSHIYVIRGNFTCPTIYWLNARTPDVLLLAEQFHLQPGDIVYVSSAVLTDWNRFLNELLPTIQAVWFTRSLVNNR